MRLFGRISHVACRPLQWHVQGWFCWLRCTSRYFPLWRRQAQNALHLGRYGPEGLLRHGAHRPDCKLWSLRSCSPSLVVDISRGAEAVSHGPDSSSDHRFSPVAVQGGRRPCLQVVQISLSWRRGLSHGPDCLDHRDSPAAVPRHGDQCPCCAGLQVPGAVVMETVEFSQLPLLRKSSFPGGPGQGCRHARWRADMGQLIVVVMS